MNYCEHMNCAQALEWRSDHIDVGHKDPTVKRLMRRDHSAEDIKIATSAWGFLMDSMMDDAVLNRVLATNSPDKAWHALEEWYAPQSRGQQDIFLQKFNNFKMTRAEDPARYFARMTTIVETLQ